MNIKRQATEHTFTSHDGQVIFYRNWKETTEQPADRVIVLLHRGHEHSGRIEHIVNELNMNDTAFFAWDVRGCGRTEGPRGYAPSFMTWVQDLDVFVQHINRQYGIPIENIVVIAQSVGAVIAATWVHDYAPKIKALILASPAFSVDLIFPGAKQGIALYQKLFGQFFVKSYVKGKQLTHDPERVKSYHTDPLVALPIASNVLLDLYTVSDRIISDAGAIVTPTQILISGKDAVVRDKQQHQFFDSLSSAIKEKHVLNGFFHDTLGELDREIAFDLIRKFVQKVESNTTKVDLLDADTKGYTFNEYQELLKPKASSFFNEINFALTRGSMKLIGKRASKGVKIGVETGFDSGSSLDYVYLNKAQGLGFYKAIGLGKIIDRGYLDSIGWQGIRIRKQNLEKLIGKYIEVLHNENIEVRIMDIASGHGRYILDAIVPHREKVSSVLLRDYSDINVKAGSEMIAERKLTAFAEFKNADAFYEEGIASVNPKPSIAVVSGVYELFSDNNLLKASLSGLNKAIVKGGYLIYTNQPWHPQVELIARTLNNHQGKGRWVMRRRTQAEMDQLVANAGFEKIEQLQDQWGIFTVSVARKL
ncbi:alpha/beta fold hydrolase [Flavobacterium sp. ZT3R18]|uniref:bifunctional alpha/beta hydrolase/class I SAM-dependent methyltransferase n=1 Tax=Flavobacterium sp. ZT3R18 TaxID=2594429 RepID=UPI00117AA231|nr:bifunctional alpha/beta hydrolase/class I SAM-dependent methyltransferase [Flavobacterium sp. ZT3R18]TRX38009.1 alpha/beta fold hydrolase [Flavobacterium sp. ZT3R18]